MTPYQRYRKYIEMLNKENKPLPVNQFGEPNLTKIASDSGMRRQWFSENLDKKFGDDDRTLRNIIDYDVQTLGITDKEPSKSDGNFRDYADLSELKKQLSIKSNEVKNLTNEVEYLKKKCSSLEVRCEELTERNYIFQDTARSFDWSV